MEIGGSAIASASTGAGMGGADADRFVEAGPHGRSRLGMVLGVG